MISEFADGIVHTHWLPPLLQEGLEQGHMVEHVEKSSPIAVGFVFSGLFVR
jgi:hypothetical protein